MVGNQQIRIFVRVEGRVQGVFFRASTQQEAERLGLSGWVRNTPDGAVELEAQGSHEAVDTLLTWCRKGPAGARVTGLDAEVRGLKAQEAGFEIRR